MIVVAYCSSKEEFYATYAYRKYVPPGSTESKKFHSWGAATIGTMFLGLLVLGSYIIGLFPALISSVLALAWYWILFDALYARLIGKPWYYLGDEADMDIWLKESLGENAGKIKTYIVLGTILIGNLCYMLFL